MTNQVEDMIGSLGQTFDRESKKDPRRWGGYAGDAQPDMSRYASMAQGGPTTPIIDQTRSNESRGFETGALGLLRNRAQGSVTPAQALQQQQTLGAVTGLYSGAASIKGGAMARAAARRTAINQGAGVAMQGAQDQQALRAREMADAAPTYFGATTDMRGQDLGVATNQANLAAGNRALGDQREGFYEGLRFDTGNADTQGILGSTAQDQGAFASNMAAKQAADASSRQFQNTMVSAGTGAFMGGLNAYGQMNPDDPNKRRT